MFCDLATHAIALVAACVLLAASPMAAAQGVEAAEEIAPLRIEGRHWVDPSGRPVRFWGVNLVAFYPDHGKADAVAANLASREINLARPHHMLRPSRDWNPDMVSGALVGYGDDSRTFDPEALDRFDYLNAALRRHGIYLAMSAHFSRIYLPGDVDILQTADADRQAWMDAMRELNDRPWREAIDVRKMLPTVDERAALLDEEFLRNLLAHRNPYTGMTYAEDPQVLSFEVRNEASTEYAVICGNRFPSYWHDKLAAKWSDHAAAAGIEGGDLYDPPSQAARELRATFLRKLDEDYCNRMRAVLRESGSIAPMTLTNLWRGENNLQLHAEQADFIENHMYGDPMVARKAHDWIGDVARTALVDKPFIIGEFNQAEGADNIKAQSPRRTMLPLSAAAYGSLHDWSGIVWFAWVHGGTVGDDGWATDEGRESRLGRMVEDGMMIDHLRTAGMLFRRGIVSPSVDPITITVDQPFTAGNYHQLMRGKYVPRPGWQNVHAIRKVFAAAPPEQQASPWFTDDLPSVITSDTGEITKDVTRRQLIVATPRAEAFSGTPADAPKSLKHLRLAGEGFATVIAVADDGLSLSETERLVLSRTALDASDRDTAAVTVRISGLKTDSSKDWHVRLTRPRRSATNAEFQKLAIDESGAVVLPAIDWHECELHLR